MRGPVYGTGAVEAVREFQRAHDLTPNGVVGPETWAALAGVQGKRDEASSPAA
jgi:peptidoglycan hydrolase-like protein with peptidoglycan-binding domain